MSQLKKESPPPCKNSTERKAHFSATLRRRILTLELAPGAVIDEQILSEEFGLSRSPIREVIHQFATEGYILLEANRAHRVSAFCFTSFCNFFVAAPLVYIANAQVAARSSTACNIEKLRSIQQRFRSAVLNNDIDDQTYLANLLYCEIGEIARNAYLTPSLKRLLIDHARLEKIFNRTITDTARAKSAQYTCMQHDLLIDAIEERSLGKVSNLIHNQMKISRRSFHYGKHFDFFQPVAT